MKKISSSLLVISLLALAPFAGNVAQAADSTAKSSDSTATTPTTPKAKRTTYPFHGTVEKVDSAAKTISLTSKKTEGGRVLKVDSNSDLEINGKRAVLADVKAGNYAHGTVHKDAAGAEIIVASKFDKEAPVKGAAVAPADASTNAPAATPPAKKNKAKATTAAPQ